MFGIYDLKDLPWWAVILWVLIAGTVIGTLAAFAMGIL